ncbi:MAG: DUF2851 family protein [Bacteroidaceae bacterium]|nr:DUF2851 family protein [Bacteroidaceae bacterium]
MEEILHYVWRHRQLPLKPLVTTQGIPLEVIDPGVLNTDAGPDFLQAKIKIGNTVWVGHVEVHLKSSDWYVHSHHVNPAYDMVVLHVVQTADRAVYNSHGEIVPQTIVPIPPRIKERFEDLRRTSRYPRCYSILPHLSALEIHSWMNSLMVERMADRQVQIIARLARLNEDWNDCLFATLARNFGFGLNGDTFERWALSFSLRAVDKHRNNLLQVEAIFFGQAGLLDDVAASPFAERKLEMDLYWKELRREYDYLSHKFGLLPISHVDWKLLRTRPHNFPHIRIAQLAYLYHLQQIDLSRLMECTTVKQVKGMLIGGTSDYWKRHYGFGLPIPEMQRQLGHSTRDLLLINSVIPFLVAYRRHRLQDENLIFSWLEEIKPENNQMIRLWMECGVVPQHAGDSQALIQLQQKYCNQNRCLHCRFGYYYMCKETKT